MEDLACKFVAEKHNWELEYQNEHGQRPEAPFEVILKIIKD